MSVRVWRIYFPEAYAPLRLAVFSVYTLQQLFTPVVGGGSNSLEFYPKNKLSHKTSPRMTLLDARLTLCDEVYFWDLHAVTRLTEFLQRLVKNRSSEMFTYLYYIGYNKAERQ